MGSLILILVVGFPNAQSAQRAMAALARATVRRNAIFMVSWLVRCSRTNAQSAQYASNRRVDIRWTANARIAKNTLRLMLILLVRFPTAEGAQYASKQGINILSPSMAHLEPRAFSHDWYARAR